MANTRNFFTVFQPIFTTYNRDWLNHRAYGIPGLRALHLRGDRRRVCPVVLVTHHKRLDELRRHQPRLMSHPANLPGPLVSTTAGFHTHDATRQVRPQPLQGLQHRLRQHPTHELNAWLNQYQQMREYSTICRRIRPFLPIQTSVSIVLDLPFSGIPTVPLTPSGGASTREVGFIGNIVNKQPQMG